MSQPDQLAALLSGIARVESGGRVDPYAAQGPTTKTGDHAYGKYQVMGANIPQWTARDFGQTLTPQQFLATPAAQEAVASHELGASFAKYGNPQDAASIWFTGRPLAQGARAADVNGMTGSRYAALATQGMSPFYQHLAPQPTSPGIPALAAQAGAPAAPAPTAEASKVDWGDLLGGLAPQSRQQAPPQARPLDQSLTTLPHASPPTGYQSPINLLAGTSADPQMSQT